MVGGGMDIWTHYELMITFEQVWTQMNTLNPPTTQRKGGFWLLSAFLLLQGADNEGGFELISAFFLLQGAGD